MAHQKKSVLLVEGEGDVDFFEALIYTWLAWQKRPGQTLDVVINGNLINWESPEMRGLTNWLTKVFEERK